MKNFKDFDLEDGQKIFYDNGVNSGTGVVRGVATVELPVMGQTYIIEDTSGQFPTEEYPYKCLVVARVHLTKKY